MAGINRIYGGMPMVIYLKENDIELEACISPIEFVSLVDLQNRGEIHCSISVKRGERVGYIPLSDIDHERVLSKLDDPHQLELVLL